VINAVERDGTGCREAARLFEISASAAIKWVQRYRRLGDRRNGGTGGYRPSKVKPHQDWLLTVIALTQDITLAALCQRFLDVRGVRVDTDTLSCFFRSEGSSFKKSVLPCEQDRQDVRRRRAGWKRCQGRLDPKRLVFIDETWAKTNMTRTHGRCRKDERLRARGPYGHWKTLTFLAALRHDRIDAPAVLGSPINGADFLAHIERFLIPTLQPGDIVVLDNLGSHAADAVRKAIRKADAKFLFLPAHSPDLNSIEQVFAKPKTLLRKAGERIVEATWKRIDSLLGWFTPHECANYFKSSGYASN
jgi:transposase